MISEPVCYQLHAIGRANIEAIGFLLVVEHLVLQADDRCDSTMHRFCHLLGGVLFLESRCVSTFGQVSHIQTSDVPVLVVSIFHFDPMLRNALAHSESVPPKTFAYAAWLISLMTPRLMSMKLLAAPLCMKECRPKTNG